jgi:Pyruvate/2-oxoacid:ferredoxin oxidoreductase delta subunit
MAVQTFEELLCKKSGLKDGILHWYSCLRTQRSKSLSLSPLQYDLLRVIISVKPECVYLRFTGPMLMNPMIHLKHCLQCTAKTEICISSTISMKETILGDCFKSQAELLKQKFKEMNGSYYLLNCAQFLQQSATYFLTSILNEWNIFYKVVHQKAKEVIITYSQVYHQGFSAGYICRGCQLCWSKLKYSRILQMWLLILPWRVY